MVSARVPKTTDSTIRAERPARHAGAQRRANRRPEDVTDVRRATPGEHHLTRAQLVGIEEQEIHDAIPSTMTAAGTCVRAR